MSKTTPKWAWWIGIPGALLAFTALVHALLSTTFVSQTAHSEEVDTWRTAHEAEARTTHEAQQQANTATMAQLDRQRDEINKNIGAVQQAIRDTRLDVNQIVCATVRKGKPIGARCVLPTGQVIDDVRVP